MMNPIKIISSIFLFISLFNLISCERWTVYVKNAYGLRDADGLWNESDSYCKIKGMAMDGTKTYQTATKDGNSDPEWYEQFIFRDDEGNGYYTGFHFRLYDEDPISSDDYLGDTTEIDSDEIYNCNKWYNYALPVEYENKQHGTLYVAIMKDECH